MARPYHRTKPLRTTITYCLVCSKEMAVYPSQIKSGEGKHCSRQCAFKDQIGKPHPNNRRRMTEEEKARLRAIRPMKGTANPFYGKKHNERTRKNISITQRNITANEWDGFSTTERHRLMAQPEYILWRKAVFERDNYTCVWCGVKGSYLQADHIKPWAKYPELRYAIDNGRTLCLGCHTQTESFPKQFVQSTLRRIES